MGAEKVASSPLCSVRIVLIQGPLDRAKDLQGTEGGARPSLAQLKHLTGRPRLPLSPVQDPKGGEGKERNQSAELAARCTHARLRAGLRASVRARVSVCVCACARGHTRV